MEHKKKVSIEFAPGAFDNFDGTQEELDAFIQEITEMAQDGSILEQSEPVTADYIEDLLDTDPLAAITLLDRLGMLTGIEDEDGNEVTYEQMVAAVKAEQKKKLH